MKIACLFSGGKDSTYALYKSLKEGHEVPCLISLHPFNDESLLYHYPNNLLFEKISKAIEIPIIERYCNNVYKEHEVDQLFSSIKQAIDQYSIEGLVHGTISSRFQLNIFQKICTSFNLNLISPIWGIESCKYYNELINTHFEILITRVAALGLDKIWLGKIIDKKNYEELRKLSEKFKFDLTFEGGEAETLVLNCPMYKKRIKIVRSEIQWDGIRGTFEILDIVLITK
ncbi:MAG: diphthine--ammonia ligase [Thermoproteota archaeon]|nr:diphthine--ammonia ligase [Thermoproteota archaeon]